METRGQEGWQCAYASCNMRYSIFSFYWVLSLSHCLSLSLGKFTIAFHLVCNNYAHSFHCIQDKVQSASDYPFFNFYRWSFPAAAASSTTLHQQNYAQYKPEFFIIAITIHLSSCGFTLCIIFSSISSSPACLAAAHKPTMQRSTLNILPFIGWSSFVAVFTTKNYHNCSAIPSI